MEKEVESLNKDILKDAKSKESVKVPAQIDGKELVKLFKNCSIVEKSKPSQVRNSKNWRNSKNNLASSSQKSFKRKKVMQKKTKKPKFRVNIRPSKLTSIVEKIQSDQKSPESRFSDFSDCSKALEDISAKPKKKATKLKKKPKSKVASLDKDSDSISQNKAPLRAQKKRKASSSCAQQARNECYNADINASMDFLADYLEETILFPKKMSYMAELMYT